MTESKDKARNDRRIALSLEGRELLGQIRDALSMRGLGSMPPWLTEIASASRDPLAARSIVDYALLLLGREVGGILADPGLLRSVVEYAADAPPGAYVLEVPAPTKTDAEKGKMVFFRPESGEMYARLHCYDGTSCLLRVRGKATLRVVLDANGNPVYDLSSLAGPQR